MKQEFLGHVRVRMQLLTDVIGDTVQGWYNLEKEPKTQEKQPGQLFVRLHYPKEDDADQTTKMRPEDPQQYYTFKGELGAGAFGLVRLCVHKATKKEYAVKIIAKQKMNQRQQELLRREIAVMAKLHHPNIVDLVEAFDTPEHTYLVME